MHQIKLIHYFSNVNLVFFFCMKSFIFETKYHLSLEPSFSQENVIHFISLFSQTQNEKMSLFIIGQQLMIYVGIFLVVTDIIGNGINVLIFSTVKTYHTNPTSIDFLIALVFNMLYILVHFV
jgi:hypothetical protein